MDFGVHLPLVDFGDGTLNAQQLRTYTAAAADLGYATLSANDYLVWQRPWLDGPTALTSVLEHAGSMALATSVALPAVRHPVVLSKWLTTLGCLTDSRVIAGLGPGSSPADYRAVGIPFEERWARFDESLAAVKALVRGERPPEGQFYDLTEVRLDPLPARAPQVCAGSWGSKARLRAMAAVADDWLASAYNTSPARFADSRARLDGHLCAAGRDPSTFPDMIVTMWLHVTAIDSKLTVCSVRCWLFCSAAMPKRWPISSRSDPRSTVSRCWTPTQPQAPSRSWCGPSAIRSGSSTSLPNRYSARSTYELGLAPLRSDP